MTVLSGVVFRFAPQARLWNARVLPFWFLCLYLLAGVAFMEAGTCWSSSLPGPGGPPGRPDRRARSSPASSPFGVGELPAAQPALRACDRVGQVHVAGHHQHRLVFYPLLGVLELLRLPIDRQGPREGVLRPRRRDDQAGPGPGLRVRPGHVGVRARARPDGHARRPHAAALLDPRLHRLAGGLYYESSATTPYHFLNAAELSDQPSNPVRGLDYPTGPDVAEGVQHLQMLGVKYFMAETPDIEAQADADSNLRLVATVGPFPVTYTTGSTTSVAAAHLEDLRGARLGRGGPARQPAGGDDRGLRRAARPG